MPFDSFWLVNLWKGLLELAVSLRKDRIRELEQELAVSFICFVAKGCCRDCGVLGLREPLPNFKNNLNLISCVFLLWEMP